MTEVGGVMGVVIWLLMDEGKEKEGDDGQR